jgi:hypothetical protein
MSSTSLFCRCIGPSLGELHHFGRAEAGQIWECTLLEVPLVGILVVNLDKTTNEEFFLFSGAGLPVIGLVHVCGETPVASPLLVHRFCLAPRFHVHIVLHLRQVCHVPCLANRKRSICVLASFVQLHLF